MIKLTKSDLVRRAERRLNQIIERRVPGVNRDANLHQKPGDKNNERGAKYRPVLPAVRAIDEPERCK